MGHPHDEQDDRITERQQRISRAQRRKDDNHRYYMNRKRERDKQEERKILLHARLPEWIVGRLQRIAAEGLVTGKYPCKNLTEAVYWVIVAGFKTLKDDPILGDKMKYAEARQAIDGIQQVRRESMALLHK